MPDDADHQELTQELLAQYEPGSNDSSSEEEEDEEEEEEEEEEDEERVRNTQRYYPYCSSLVHSCFLFFCWFVSHFKRFFILPFLPELHEPVQGGEGLRGNLA